MRDAGAKGEMCRGSRGLCTLVGPHKDVGQEGSSQNPLPAEKPLRHSQAIRKSAFFSPSDFRCGSTALARAWLFCSVVFCACLVPTGYRPGLSLDED